MSKTRLIGFAVLATALLVLPACGGGGQGLRLDSNAVKVASTSLPSKLSGETLNHVIPLDGGCGGPYVLKVISGRMPDGLELDNENHAITGYVGEDGSFSFTVEVTDTGCIPFSSTTATFGMDVGVGAITVVGIRKDGNPAKMVAIGEGYSPADERPPEEQTPYNPDWPAFPETIFNELTLIEMVIAGGKGPFEINIYDDPGIDDSGLPLGVSVIPDSTSFTGTPIQEASTPTGAFLHTIEITDSLGSKGYFTANWLVYSPPLYIGTESLGSGECGQLYSEQFFLSGGIPPFVHNFVDALGSRTKIDNAYPAQGDTATDYTAYNCPPEGLYVEEDAGRFRGVPRRRGMFQVTYFAYSTLLPFSPTQNKWREFTFNVIVAGDLLAQDSSYTQDGPGFSASDPYNRLPSVEIGRTYNPDAATHPTPGLQALAGGGVPFDGLSDHAHLSQINADPVAEVPDTYEWAVAWGTDGPMAGMELTIDGVFRISDVNLLEKQGYRDLSFAVQDQALPSPLAGNVPVGLRIQVGPDTLIVTTSSSSFTGGSGSVSNSFDVMGFDDREMTVQAVVAYEQGAELSNLTEAANMAGEGAGQHGIPATAGSLTGDPLAALLQDIDVLRVSVNPNGWWNDNYNMNPRGARSAQHTDMNRARETYHGNQNGYVYVYNYQSGSYTYGYVNHYGAQPETPAVDIPKYNPHKPEGSSDPAVGSYPDMVTHDPDGGVYTDGGKLYCFDTSTRFGVFIVRDDAKIYVPVAIEKGVASTLTAGKQLECFGDNVNSDYSTTSQMTIYQIPQMTVSPDGRYAALKVMTEPASYHSSIYANYGYGNDWTGDSASEAGIVIFSLTGERPTAWGGRPYVVVGTGSAASASYGTHMLASTMTLTNHQLYYVCANRGYYSAYSWREQYVYRYDLMGGATAGSMLRDDLGAAADNDPEWTNAPGDWMQLPCGKTDRPAYAYSYSYSSGSYGYSYNYSYINGSITEDGIQAHEGSVAPVPFRVSADGNSCVIIAGRETVASGTSSLPYGGTDWHQHHVFLDYDDGSGATLYRLSSQRRRIPQGTSRGYKLSGGLDYYIHHFGARNGPQPNVEISDDGSKVAVCVSRWTGAVFGYSSYSYSTSYGGYNPYGQYASGNWRARQDIIAFEPANGTSWSSTGLYNSDGITPNSGETEIQVTGSESTATPVFSSTYNIQWRFGALTFTKENDGLVFWGGRNSYSPTYSGYTSSFYYNSFTFVGSMYAYEFGEAGIANLLATTDGGASGLTPGTKYTSIGNSGSGWYGGGSTWAGTIKPIGGFISRNREYLYIANQGGLSSTKRENIRLIGINICSLSGDDAANNHTEGEGFTVGDNGVDNDTWPTRRGFTIHYGSSSYPYMYFGIGRTSSYWTYSSQSYRYQAQTPGGIYGAEVVMAKDSGYVFFGAHYQNYGPGSTTSYTGPLASTYTNYQYYGPYAGQLAVFSGDAGGNVEVLTTLPQSTSTTYTSPTQYVKYIEPAPDGHSVSYVWSSKASYSYPTGHNYERIGYVTSLYLDEDGEVDESREYDASLEDLNGSNGRVASSVAPGPLGDSLYFARGSTSDEDSKVLYMRREGSSSNVNFGFATSRWNILHAAR